MYIFFFQPTYRSVCRSVQDFNPMEERRLPRVSDRDDHMHARPRDLVISPDRHDPFAGKHTIGQSRYSTFIHDLSPVMFECRSLAFRCIFVSGCIARRPGCVMWPVRCFLSIESTPRMRPPSVTYRSILLCDRVSDVNSDVCPSQIQFRGATIVCCWNECRVSLAVSVQSRHEGLRDIVRTWLSSGCCKCHI